MKLDAQDLALLAAIEDGLPLAGRPYAQVGARLGLGEDEVMARLAALGRAGIIKRFGLIVRHHELGYRANAMVVWDVPDDRVDILAKRAAAAPFVTLCYRRPRRPPEWPYNLFCMVHGRDREIVLEQIAALARATGLDAHPSAVLFSRRRFKQQGARFGAALKQAV